MRRSRRSAQSRFIELNPRLCRACWKCCEACPVQALGKVSVLWHRHAVFRAGDDCIGCGKCVSACAAGALRRRAKEERP
ncbi:MAG: hypothetical protein QM765_27520 [Myxococcales bacterium]